MTGNVEFEILVTDQYNKNGHIYSKEMMEQAIKEFNEREHPMVCELNARVENGYFAPVDIFEVSHEVTDLKLEGDKVFATMKVLDTPKGKIMQEILSLPDHEYVFRPYGTCRSLCDGIIEDYTLLGVAMLHKDDAA